MKVILQSLTALFMSLFILLVGHGLQLTLSPLYADALGWSPSMIGYIGSSYFFGFVVGCFTVPWLVARVGHIRVFVVLAASASASLLILGLTEMFVIWFLAKSVTGWAIAGLYMVIESWLNEKSSPKNRGSVLSIYTTLTLVAICAGQLLVGVGFDYQEMIICAAMLLALGAMPVGLTASSAPAPIAEVGFKLREVYDASHVAVLGALTGGMVTAGFWALGPLVAKAQGLAVDQVGTFMAVTLFGGALVQLPVGRLSDHYDRRLVIGGLALFGTLVCLSAALVGVSNHYVAYLFMFLFGACTFPLYSICLAHANDNTELRLIEVGSVILVMHSLGSVIGPVLISTALGYTASGFFIVAGVLLATFGIWTFFRLTYHQIARRYFEPFQKVSRTTHEVIELSRETE